MLDLFETELELDKEKDDEDEWVEISDADGHRASLRLLATIRDGSTVYHVLGASYNETEEDEEEAGGILLVREERIADGAQEYVVADDDQEIERIMTHFVLNAAAMRLMARSGEDGEALCPCGLPHKPGEFCFCGDPDMLQ